MKNFKLFGLVMLLGTMLMCVSCEKHQNVKDYAKNFAEAVNKGDSLDIMQYFAVSPVYDYPWAEVNLAQLDPENITVEEVVPYIYTVKFGDDISVQVNENPMNGENSLSMALPHNIFLPDPEKVKVAEENYLLDDYKKNSQYDDYLFIALKSRAFKEAWEKHLLENAQ